VWDLAGHELVEPIRGVSWLTVDVARDGRLIVGDAGKFQKDPETSAVGIWTPDGRRREHLFEGVGAAALRTVALSPDGDWLLTASALGGARLYRSDKSRDRRLASGQASSGEAMSATFDRDGTRALVAHWSGSLEVWRVGFDAQAPDVRIECSDDTWFAEFAPDGRTVASAHASGLVRIWDLADPRQPRRTWRAHPTGGIMRVRFAPKSSQLLTVSRDGTVRLWCADGRLIATLAGHQGDLWDAVFSPDGSRIATASNDGKIRVWWTRTADLVRAARTRSPRLTAEQREAYRDLLPGR
jgi:WD40 repeat protein